MSWFTDLRAKFYGACVARANEGTLPDEMKGACGASAASFGPQATTLFNKAAELGEESRAFKQWKGDSYQEAVSYPWK
jgi:hypothetical protein